MTARARYASMKPVGARANGASDLAVGSSKSPIGAFAGTLLLISTALVCATVVIAAPRAVEPSRLPALRLSAAASAAQLASERRLAAHASEGAEESRVIALIEREGNAELSARTDLAELATERAELAQAASNLFARLGEPGTRAFLAMLAERAESALASSTSTSSSVGSRASTRALLGNFPRLLIRYGYADASGQLLAPALAIRAFFKTRLNLITERPTERGLSKLELQAFFGWNALHAGALEPEHRAKAARVFYEQGGTDGAEAYAIWLYQGGAPQQAASMLEREYARSGLIRLRNMALFAARP